MVSPRLAHFTRNALKSSVMKWLLKMCFSIAAGMSAPAAVSFTASWDVWKHTREPIELYGTEVAPLDRSHLEATSAGRRGRYSEEHELAS